MKKMILSLFFLAGIAAAVFMMHQSIDEGGAPFVISSFLMGTLIIGAGRLIIWP